MKAKQFLLNINIIIILFIVYIITNYNGINDTYNSLFYHEINQFLYEKRIIKNIFYCKNIESITQLRRKLKYKKRGYGGHPKKYIFSYPLDMKTIVSPNIIGRITKLVVFIHSRPSEFYERMISRKIYKNNKDVCIIYITSKSKRNNINYKIKKEALIHNDIIQFNEISSYFNLSIQTVHMLLWSFNIRYKYLLKSDNDVYINFPLLINLLRTKTAESKYYALGKVSKAFVIRDSKYSHYVPKEIIKEKIYPTYLQGVGYIIPYHTVKVLVKSIKYVEPKIWIEDVFMGYLFKYNNIALYDLSKYIIRDLPYNISSLIKNKCNYILIHGFYPIEIYALNSLSCNGQLYQ